ncbi:MAG: glycosyltransferase family 1 protein [Rhodoferax sp.]|nr:glycosyltransferase family 1 protein [Rhodoferax sp.]
MLSGLISKLRRQIGHYLVRLWPGKSSTGSERAVPDFSELSAFEQSVNYFAREYPRFLDRKMLIQLALQVSRSLELYGPGWNMHPEFRPYTKGIIDTQIELLDVYSRTRITLANNTHGLGLHSRTLECMAVGGFVLTHKSPHDFKPGGMQTSFEPNVHYGVFTPDTFQQEAQRWLTDDVGRVKVGQRAAAIIRQKHCWHHRAQQILDDLDK